MGQLPKFNIEKEDLEKCFCHNHHQLLNMFWCKKKSTDCKTFLILDYKSCFFHISKWHFFSYIKFYQSRTKVCGITRKVIDTKYYKQKVYTPSYELLKRVTNPALQLAYTTKLSYLYMPGRPGSLCLKEPLVSSYTLEYLVSITLIIGKIPEKIQNKGLVTI